MDKTAQARLIVVQTTLDDADRAEAFARRLVEAKLAACVQVSAIASVYRWGGAVEAAEEWLLSAKTLRDTLPALQAFIAEHHPYDEPELIVLPVLDASEGYAAWVEGSVE